MLAKSGRFYQELLVFNPLITDNLHNVSYANPNWGMGKVDYCLDWSIVNWILI